MTSSQETERVYSYNPGARTGPFIWSICILFFLQLSFNGQSGPTWVSRYQNVKPSWILLQQEIMEVVMMPIRNISCANPQSNHHHQHTSTQFLQAGCPSYHQTNSVKALKASIYFCISQKNCFLDIMTEPRKPRMCGVCMCVLQWLLVSTRLSAVCMISPFIQCLFTCLSPAFSHLSTSYLMNQSRWASMDLCCLHFSDDSDEYLMTLNTFWISIWKDTYM